MDKITSETRRASLESIRETVQLRRDEVLLALSRHGRMDGLTAEELATVMMTEAYIVRPRLTELLESGAVHVIGKRLSEKTGKKIAVWRVAL